MYRITASNLNEKHAMDVDHNVCNEAFRNPLTADMSGLSYFAVQNQSWSFETVMSKELVNHSTKVLKIWNPSPNESKILAKYRFLMMKITQLLSIK